MKRFFYKSLSKKDPSSESDEDQLQLDWNEELIRAVRMKFRFGKSQKHREKIILDRMKEILCQDGRVDINTRDAKGNTILHVAVKKNYQQIVKFLRDEGARTDILNRKDDTAISLAKNLKRHNILSILNEASRQRNQTEGSGTSTAFRESSSTSPDSTNSVDQQKLATVVDDSKRMSSEAGPSSSEHDQKITKTPGITEERTYSATVTMPPSYNEDIGQQNQTEGGGSSAAFHKSSSMSPDSANSVDQQKLATVVDDSKRMSSEAGPSSSEHDQKITKTPGIMEERTYSATVTMTPSYNEDIGQQNQTEGCGSSAAFQKSSSMSPDSANSVDQQKLATVGDDSGKMSSGVEPSLSEHDQKVEKYPAGIVEERTYSAAATLTRSWPGLVYQLKHLAYTLHCASQQKDPYFFLATEMVAAEKLDDVVLLYKSDSGRQVGRFVQIKYTSNQIGRISAKQLLETDGNFSVLTYFMSWRKVKENKVFRKIEVRNMILCTNMGLDLDDLEKRGIHYENAAEPDEAFVLKSNVKKTSWYRLLADKSSNEELYNELKETSNVRRLAKAMAKCICEKKDMRLEMGIFRDYHHALVNHVFNTKTKKFHDVFVKNEGLSHDVEKFRELFLEEFEKMERPRNPDSQSAEEPVWTRIQKLFQKLGFRQDFGNASKSATNSQRDELPDDYVDDLEISNFLEEFTLAVDQPNEDELNEIIRDKIDAGSRFNLLNNQLIDSAFQTKMLDWFVKKDEHEKGQEYLSYKVGEKFFNDMNDEVGSIMTIGVNSVYCEQLKAYGVHFESELLQVKDFLTEDRSDLAPDRILELIAPEKTLFTALRVYDTLQKMQEYKKMDSYIFTSVDSLKLPGIWNTVMTTFDSLHHPDLLIIDCGTIGAEQYLQTLWNPLCTIMASKVHKRMIIITRLDQDSGTQFRCGHQTYQEKYCDHSFNNLDVESQKLLLRKRVTKFQGQATETSFGTLLGIQDSGNLTIEELKDCVEVIGSNTLVELICKDEIEIGGELEGMGDVEEYYINRTVCRHVSIKLNILNDLKIRDLFFVSGIIVDNFSPMASNVEYCTILDSERKKEEFEALCKSNLERNVHWLERKPAKYLWLQSQGYITSLVKHRAQNDIYDEMDRTDATYLNEDQLAVHDQPLIISDTAGMGKSTVLTHLAWKIKKKRPNILVLRIDLNRNTTALSEVKETSNYNLGDINEAVQFLVEQLLSHETELARRVFKNIIKKKINVALIFDGFDEISPTYESTVIDLLHTLVNHGVTRLFVATRPHTRELLESKLNVFSYEIEPLSANDQEDFLVKYWKNRFGSRPGLEQNTEDRIKKYAKAMMIKLSESIIDQRNKFTGIPLQARLVAEIFEHHSQGKRENFDSCKEFIESKDTEPKFPRKINLIYLYENFVNKKFDIFFNKIGDNLANVAVREFRKLRYEKFVKTHINLALGALFDEDKVQKLLPFRRDLSRRSVELTNQCIVEERTGIITQIIDGRAHFGHRTYAEYFTAKFFSEELDNCDQNQSLREIFVGDILLGENYGNIRAFMNCLLTDEHNALTGESWKSYLNEHRSQLNETILHIAAREGNEQLIKIFLNCLGTRPRDRKDLVNVRDHLTRTAVHRAVKYGHMGGIQLLVQGTYFEIDSQDILGSTPLHIAAYGGQLDVVKFLLDQHANILSQTEEGCTPLHAAAQKGELDIVKYLLDKGANVNSVTNHCWTPLHEAARQGHSNVVEYLIENGANVNFTETNCWTPLHVAAYAGELNVVKNLLENGADIDAQEIYGRTPLYIAAQNGHCDIVEYLLDMGAHVNAEEIDGWTPLHVAAISDEFGIVKYLLNKGANIHAKMKLGCTPLYAAAQEGNLDVVKCLLKEGAEVESQDKYGRTPLYIAADRSEWDVVRYLLDMDANANCQVMNGRTVVYMAAYKGQWDVVKYMLDKGADVNTNENDGWTLLHLAAHENQLDIVKCLLDMGANVNARESNGRTPLYMAGHKGHWDAAKYLIQKGANVNFGENRGWTPLHLAAHEGQLDPVEYLLDRGANVNAEERDGWTPLYVAVHEGHWDLVKYFLEKGASHSLQKNNDSALLHLAACAGKLDVVKFLIDNGAHHSHEINGWTPLYMAARRDQWDVVKYLLIQETNANPKANDGCEPLQTDDRGRLCSATSDGRFDPATYLLHKETNFSCLKKNHWMVLHLATVAGELDVVKYSTCNGVDVNYQDVKGRTVLYIAADNGRWEVMKYLLLVQGVDVNVKTKDGWTPLHLVAHKGQLDLVKCLLEKGANVDCQESDGRTPLYMAAQEGQLDVVKYLLEHGANVDSKENNLCTPLHTAAANGHLEVVKYLLNKGADINSATEYGWTPLHAAAQEEQADVLEYLLGEVAKLGAKADAYIGFPI